MARTLLSAVVIFSLRGVAMLTTAEKCNNTTVRCNSSLWLVGQKTNRLVQRYYTLLDALGLNAKRRCRRCLVRRSCTASPRVRLATFVITPHTHYGIGLYTVCAFAVVRGLPVMMLLREVDAASPLNIYMLFSTLKLQEKTSSSCRCCAFGRQDSSTLRLNTDKMTDACIQTVR